LFRTATAAVTAVAALGISLPGQAGASAPGDGAGGTGGTASADRTAGTPLHSGSIGLGSTTTMPSGPEGVARSRRLDTAAYKMVAVTWRGAASPDVAVRTRSGGSWSGWRELDPMEDTPTATELLWVGRSDGVQVRLAGKPVRRTRVQLVDPGTLPSDTRSPAPAAPRGDSANPTYAPQPVIRSRAAWGADESWRDGGPVYNRTIKQAHIHHTAGTNAYSRSDVPAIIRGDYWYHTQVLGWSDLGYNFVVDKFGRIWEGRAGGIDRPVRGAHTLGFNHESFGVAAIGNFDSTAPPPELVRSLVRLSAWKLDRYDRQPSGYTRVRSEGSDRYPEGTWVRLPVIDGHRDTNQTACPGDALYAKLPEIRRRAQARADAVYAPGP
jgi:hypothetical protein